MNAREFPGEVEKIDALIDAARKLAGENRAFDLAALERRIGRLCGAVRGSRPDDPAELRRSLTGLIAALDELAGAVTPKIEATSSAGTAETRAHALGAYSNAGD